MKRILAISQLVVVLVVFLITFSTNCMCYDTIYGFIDMPSQVVKGESFTVNLQAQCNSDVGVVMFTLVHSDNVKYKDCKVNDNSCGYIEDFYTDNTLSVFYINTKGITATSKTNLVEVTFVADDTTAIANMQVCTSYGASSDEVELDGDSGGEYVIEITDKITDNQPAKDESNDDNHVLPVVNNGSSSSIDNPIEYGDKATEKTSIYQTATKNSSNIIAVSGKSDFRLFIAGGVFVLAVVAVIMVSYSLGSKKADKINNKNK